MRRRARLALATCAALGVLCALGAHARTGTGPGGYVWKDCEEPDGPPCDYVIQAVSDGLTGLCSDEIYAPPGGIGFSFPFYGMTFGTVSVSANGVAYLSNPPVADPSNAALTGLEGRPILAPLWDDWAMDNDDDLAFICPDPGCANSGPLTFVESYRLGSGVDAGGVRYRDIEWFDTAKHRPTCSEPQAATFGLRLYEDGRILFNYFDTDVGQPAETDAGISATIGVSRGFLGERTQVSFNTAQIPYVPYAILFEPPCPGLACNSITAPADACEGDVITFRANIGGGTPPYDVTWDFDGDTLPDAGGNPTTWPLDPGTTTVTAFVTDACSQVPGPTCSTSRDVTVHPPPVPAVTPSGATSFCAVDGESVSLVADAGFASYRWQRDGVDVPGGTSSTLVATITGSYVVRVADAFGCTGSSAPIAVDAQDCAAGCTPLACEPILVSPSPACEGTQVSLTAVFSGGEGTVRVRWDVDGDGAPDLGPVNPLRRVFPAGATRVTAFVEDTCAVAPQSCSADALVVVNPTPNPVITPDGPLSFCAADGESVTLDAGTGWASYQWTRDGADVSAATDPTVVADVSGTWTVRVTDAAGCVGESLPVETIATDCISPCDALACGVITVAPSPACEGGLLRFDLDVTGGVAPVGVAWDVDDDGSPEGAGNPADIAVPAGTYRVHAVAVDACTTPDRQSCDAYFDLVVLPGAPSIGEVSGSGDPPLLVVSKAGRVEVEDASGADRFHAYVDRIGSWWAPSDATGRQCRLAAFGPGARPGTVALDVALPASSWLVVVGANDCAEGPAGASSRGVARETGVGWTPCGP